MTNRPPLPIEEPVDRPDCLVRFDDICKSYDGRHMVVNHLNLDVYQGEFLTLLGPSGSGKTTTLMMLAGFEQPSSGEIWLGRKKINELPPHRRNIGVVFQNYALFPHMSVRQNVAYPLKIRKVSARETAQRVDHLLEMVKMEEFADRNPESLSGGQKQRIALARAVAFEPPLILMDEPLGALDKRLREHMQLELMELQKALSLTVVYVTHDQSEALTMSDRVAVFDGGLIQQVGSAAEMYERPQNSMVATFLGDNNVLTGTIGAVQGQRITVRCAGDQEITCLSDSHTFAAGDPVRVCIRPEKIALAAGPNPVQNSLRATCTKVVYRGDHLLIFASIGRERIEILAKLLSDRIGAPLPHPGEDITLCFDHDNSWLLGIVDNQ